MSVLPLRFQAGPATDLRCAHWDDQYVLFHRPSGRTHFVNESTWLLLQQILSEPRDVTWATEELARLQQLTLDEGTRSHVLKLLMRLEEIGLVVRA